MAKVSRRDLMAAGAGLLPFASLAAVAAAQEGTTTTTNTTPTGTTRVGQNAGAASAARESLDPPMAACLLITGRKQIEVCRFALEKIQDDEVKAFAQAEIDEHETLKKKLQELGYQYPTAPTSRGDAANENTNPTPNASANANVNANAAGRPTARGLAVGRFLLPPSAADMIRIDHEVKQQCIETTRTEQSKLSGLKFDKRFIGSQLDAHYGLFDHDVVFRKHASRDLAPLLDEARTIIEKHITTCKELMEKLDASKDDAKK